MKIATPKQLDQENIVGDFDSIKASIDLSSLPFLFEMMSKNLYSNPIGSICREITSNCFDSHVEAQVDTPVVIRKGYDEEGWYISFNDFGVGLSPERMTNIYMNYFSSTKRDNNNEIGGFGLGSKSPLSYTDYFYINTNFEGIKYGYIFSKGDSVPTLDKLTEEETQDRNGTEVRIYMKRGDISTFREELSKQLCYFDNVYFQDWDIDNDYFIYENENFKFRNKDQYSNEMHICYGKVSYPIDWEEINLSRIETCVGIKFNIGDLEVTSNRESLRYTEKVKELVKAKVLQVKDQLIAIYNEQNVVMTDFKAWYEVRDEGPSILFGSDRLKLDLNETLKGSRFDLFEKFPLLYTHPNILDILYSEKKVIRNGKETKGLRTKITRNFVEGVYKYSVLEEFNYSNVKNWAFSSGSLLKRNSLTDSFEDSNLFKESYIDSSGRKKVFFKLGSHKELYKIVKHFREIFEKNLPDYHNISEQKIQEYKELTVRENKAIQRKLNKEVYVTYLPYKDNENIKLDKLLNSTCFIVYGDYKDLPKLEKVEFFLKQFNTLKDKWGLNKRTCKILLVSQETKKHFKNCKHMIDVNNLHGDNILFRRLASSLKIEKFFSEFSSDSTLKKISEIFPDLGRKIQELRIFLKNNSYNSRGNDFSKPILDLAEKLDLFDYYIEPTFKQVEGWFKGIEIIKSLNIDDDKSKAELLKFLRKNKKRMGTEYYQNVPVESSLEDQLTLFPVETLQTKYEINTNL